MTNSEITEMVLKSCHEKDPLETEPIDYSSPMCQRLFHTWSLITETENHQAKVIDCPCRQKVIRYTRYNNANIPMQWWNFTVDNLHEDFDQTLLANKIQPFLDNPKLFIENKAQYLFTGEPDSGKTTIALLMLKAIIDAGMSAILTTSHQIIQKMYGNEEDVYDYYANYDFIVVDEVDKLQHRGSMIFDFCNFFESMQAKKSLIIISNRSFEELVSEEIYPSFYRSRLQELTTVDFPIGSYRTKLRKGSEIAMEILEKSKKSEQLQTLV